MEGKKTLVKSHISHCSVNFSLDDKPFAEVFFGSNTSKPYVSFGREYQKIYTEDSVYELIKRVQQKSDEIAKFILDFENYDKNLPYGWSQNETHLNEYTLNKIEQRMFYFIESKLGISINDFWKSKENLKKLLDISNEFCATFFKEPYYHLHDIISYCLKKEKEPTTGYIIYMLMSNRYHFRMEPDDFEIVAKNFNQPEEFIRSHFNGKEYYW